MFQFVNTDQILGTPEILAEDFLSATNISGTTYNIGIMHLYTTPENGYSFGNPFNDNGPVTLNMIVNALKRCVKLNLAAGINEDGMKVLIFIQIQPVRCCMSKDFKRKPSDAFTMPMDS